jgi:RNA polymerase sigma-70 factor (ECF subfamily)
MLRLAERTMSAPNREELERGVRRLCEEGDAPGAAAAAIRAYGPEILGFLVATLRNDDDAEEVFSLWCERLFRGILRFSWDASLRTWGYTIARNATSNFVRGKKNRARHELAAESAELAAVEAKVRTKTRSFLRTEVKDKLTAIRDALPQEDRMLLVLRVDKRLEWKDLARVMLGEEAEITDEVLSRESARLRKRFQLVKEKLVEAGKREGLIGDGR